MSEKDTVHPRHEGINNAMAVAAALAEQLDDESLLENATNLLDDTLCLATALIEMVSCVPRESGENTEVDELYEHVRAHLDKLIFTATAVRSDAMHIRAARWCKRRREALTGVAEA